MEGQSSKSAWYADLPEFHFASAHEPDMNEHAPGSSSVDPYPDSINICQLASSELPSRRVGVRIGVRTGQDNLLRGDNIGFDLNSKHVDSCQTYGVTHNLDSHEEHFVRSCKNQESGPSNFTANPSEMSAKQSLTFNAYSNASGSSGDVGIFADEKDVNCMHESEACSSRKRKLVEAAIPSLPPSRSVNVLRIGNPSSMSTDRNAEHTGRNSSICSTEGEGSSTRSRRVRMWPHWDQMGHASFSLGGSSSGHIPELPFPELLPSPSNYASLSERYGLEAEGSSSRGHPATFFNPDEEVVPYPPRGVAYSSMASPYYPMSISGEQVGPTDSSSRNSLGNSLRWGLNDGAQSIHEASGSVVRGVDNQQMAGYEPVNEQNVGPSNSTLSRSMARFLLGGSLTRARSALSSIRASSSALHESGDLNPAAGLNDQPPHLGPIHPAQRENSDAPSNPMSRLNARREARRRMITEAYNMLNILRQGGQVGFEDMAIFNHPLFLHGGDLFDRHRDMRLDVDNMSYEELLALGERIGNVSTGLSEEVIMKHLKQWKFICIASEPLEELEPCCICREDYMEGEDVGRLDCGHDFHTVCIKLWLVIKNLCPICKTTALNTT